MPRATVNLDPGEETKLKSCVGAFVTLRRMSYGAKLERQSQAMKMSMEMKKGRKDSRAEIDMLTKASTMFDFRMCLVDHNLEDPTGRKLDLTREDDFNNLDPQIGEEISTLIDKLNNFEDVDDGDSEGN